MPPACASTIASPATCSTYAPNARKIHIEIDPSEINKNVPVDVALIGDLRDVLKRLMPSVAAGQPRALDRHINGLKGDSAVRDIQTLPDDGHLYAAHVINDLWRATRSTDTIVVTDVGQHQMWEAQYYHHEAPRSLITSGGLGTMGFAVPAAIGAKRARPDAEVWAVVGDGGFQMTMCELATAVQEGIAIKVAHHQQRLPGHGAAVAGVLLRAALRGDAAVRARLRQARRGVRRPRHRRSRERGDVLPAVDEARSHAGPVVIDFRVEQEDTVYPMVPAGADLHAMIRRPNPIVETGADV